MSTNTTNTNTTKKTTRRKYEITARGTDGSLHVTVGNASEIFDLAGLDVKDRIAIEHLRSLCTEFAQRNWGFVNRTEAHWESGALFRACQNAIKKSLGAKDVRKIYDRATSYAVGA